MDSPDNKPPPDGPARPSSELLDTAPGRPAFLASPEPEPSASTEPGLPPELFDELLSAAKETPAIPERADSAGAKNARYAGEGRPQKARQETKPTGEVLVDPAAMPVRIREAPNAADIDLEALAAPRARAGAGAEDPEGAAVRGALRAAMTEPSARALVESEDTSEDRRRMALGLLIGVVFASLSLGIALFFLRNHTPVTPPGAPSGAPPPVASAPVSPVSPVSPSSSAAPPPTAAAASAMPATSGPALPHALQAPAKPTASASGAPTAALPQATAAAPSVPASARPTPAPVPSDITHNIN